MPRGQFTTRLSEVFLQSVTPPRIATLQRVLLFDFTTGQSTLLEGHREGIHQHVLLHLRGEAEMGLWIGGLASRRGDEAFNTRLARVRAATVENYIFRLLSGSRARYHATVTSFGERLSTTHVENSEYYRSVLVILYRNHIPASPEPHADLMEGVFNRFRIRLTGSVEGGDLFVMGEFHFLIDYDRSQPNSPPSAPVHYVLRAYGAGGGAPYGASVENPEHPAWNAFVAPFVTTSGFGGQARRGSVGVGYIISAGHTTLRIFPRATEEVIVFDRLETSGSAVQLGAAEARSIGMT